MTGGQLAKPIANRLRESSRGEIPLRLVPLLLCLPVMFTLEYQEFEGALANLPYRLHVGAGFRLVDVVILGLAGVHLVLAHRTRLTLRFPASLAIPLSLFVVAWAISVAYGFLTGGTELLYDWRSIVLGVVIALMTVTSVRNRRESRVVLDTLLLLSGAVSTGVLLVFAAGGGVHTEATGRIPLWDHHTLNVLGFSAVLSVALWLTGAPQRRFALACGAPCALVVLLASRRNSWGELLFALGLLLLLEGGTRRRVHALGVMALLLAVAAAAMGPSRVVTRVRSMNPTATGTPETSTNSGHVGDVLDAWDAVKTSPILGIGQGKPYSTSRIIGWKTESWMVHNAPLHVWVRYGALGLLAYFWWHAAYFRYLGRWRRRWRAVWDDEARTTSAMLLAALCWSAGWFVVGLLFSEWPYTSLQRMVVIGTLWGLTLHPSVRDGPPSAVSRLAVTRGVRGATS